MSHERINQLLKLNPENRRDPYELPKFSHYEEKLYELVLEPALTSIAQQLSAHGDVAGPDRLRGGYIIHAAHQEWKTDISYRLEFRFTDREIRLVSKFSLGGDIRRSPRRRIIAHVPRGQQFTELKPDDIIADFAWHLRKAEVTGFKDHSCDA